MDLVRLIWNLIDFNIEILYKKHVIMYSAEEKIVNMYVWNDKIFHTYKW